MTVDDRRELERIRESYAARKATAGDKYSCFEPAALLEIQQRERLLLPALAEAGKRELSRARILDVGCGTGDVLRSFLRYGAQPGGLHGIDLLAERLATARQLAPHLQFVHGNATALPYGDDVFDVVTQFTAFSSVLDPAWKARIAGEMLRVLRPDGVIVWYDFWLNPTNRAVKGIGTTEVRRLFPGCRWRFRRLTLAPPLARALAKRSVLLCQILERVPFLLTHYLAIIRPLTAKEIHGLGQPFVEPDDRTPA